MSKIDPIAAESAEQLEQLRQEFGMAQDEFLAKVRALTERVLNNTIKPPLFEIPRQAPSDRSLRANHIIEDATGLFERRAQDARKPGADMQDLVLFLVQASFFNGLLYAFAVADIGTNRDTFNNLLGQTHQAIQAVSHEIVRKAAK